MGLLKTLSLAKERQKSNRENWETLKTIQHNKFLKLVEYAKKNSKFYAHLYRYIKVDSNLRVDSLPVINKDILMDNFDDFLTDNRIDRKELEEFLEDKNNIGKKFKDIFTVFYSAGTTGKKGIFVNQEWNYRIAPLIVRINAFSFLKPKRVAMITITDMPLVSLIWAKSWPKPLIKYEIISVKEPLTQIIDKLNSFKPKIIGTYSTFGGILAQERRAGTLKINIEKIFLGGEPVTSELRENIREAFGGYPYNYYAASEIGTIAEDCESHVLHVPIYSLILEVVDHNNEPLPPGKPGWAIITNLYNYTQPLIRYKMDDIIQFAPDSYKCPCGLSLPVIEKIEGREKDMLYIEKSKNQYEILSPQAFSFSFPGIQKLQVIQEERNKLSIKIAPNSKTNKNIIEKTRNEVYKILQTKQLHEIVKVNYEIVDDIPSEPSGKFKMVISKVGKPSEI